MKDKNMLNTGNHTKGELVLPMDSEENDVVDTDLGKIIRYKRKKWDTGETQKNTQLDQGDKNSVTDTHCTLIQKRLTVILLGRGGLLQQKNEIEY